MAGLQETVAWPDEIYQIEQTDPVHGGPPDLALAQGFTNVPHKELADRTAWLKAQVEALQTEWANIDVSSDIQAAINALIDGAPAALDTLNELAVAIGDNDSEVAALVSALAGKLGVVDQAADAAALAGQPAAFFQNAGNLNAGLLPMARLALATQAEAEAGTSSAKIMTPLSTSQQIAVTALGVGQTWQDMTASRAVGVAYQNVSNQPMQVVINMAQHCDFEISMDNVTWVIVTEGASGENAVTSAIIPPWGYYKSASALFVNRWMELK